MIKYLLLCLMFSFPLHSEVLDTDRVWREHVITDVTTNSKLNLVGYLPHPSKEHDIDLPYMLHVGAINKNRSFYANLTTLKNDIHPKEQIIVYVDNEKFAYNAKSTNIGAIADTIRNSESSIALRLFSYDELNTCTGRFLQLVSGHHMSIQYVTSSMTHKTIVLDLDGLYRELMTVYGTPDSCR